MNDWTKVIVPKIEPRMYTLDTRDHFALAAMQAIRMGNSDYTVDVIAVRAYALAEAMLRERDRLFAIDCKNEDTL